MVQLLVATSNENKVKEVSASLAELFTLVSLREFPALTMPDETGATMAENARLKARYCAQMSGLPAFADDSGIEVDALGGAPGVNSARWVEGSDFDRNRALLQRLETVEEEKRTARFRCAVCVAFPDGKLVEAEAVCEGTIAFSPRGENGFGYDPLFVLSAAEGVPSVYIGSTMAEVPAEIKRQISHRARALRQLKGLLQKVLLQNHSTA